MNISELLQPSNTKNEAIKDSELTMLWEKALEKSGFKVKSCNERNSLTDSILSPIMKRRFNEKDIPIHIKVIGRHLNGSFRCHIGTSKASRPIESNELDKQMRLLAVFFRTENAKSPLVSPEFIFFPTWLLHLFRYTQHGSTPGRTDVRFLENENMAKEDHIYRLNHVLNSLFRFNLRDFDSIKLNNVIELANFLFDNAGLDCPSLPRPILSSDRSKYPHLPLQPTIYTSMILLLHNPRPAKFKPMCLNCNTKFASRRKLCVACYRYQLKHGEPRPLRLIVANRPGPKIIEQRSSELSIVMYPNSAQSQLSKKFCANCGVNETHQWYRNLCGSGHWCETCKSYYLRHNKIRPSELFIKAAKRKVDVRSLVSWSDWSLDQSPTDSTLSSPYSQPITPPSESSNDPNLYRRRSSAFYFCK